MNGTAPATDHTENGSVADAYLWTRRAEASKGQSCENGHECETMYGRIAVSELFSRPMLLLKSQLISMKMNQPFELTTVKHTLK